MMDMYTHLPDYVFMDFHVLHVTTSPRVRGTLERHAASVRNKITDGPKIISTK